MKHQLAVMGVIPVVAIEDAKDTTALGEALLAGGLPCAEITFRTEAAEKSIQILCKKFPHLLVGAGTVLSIDQAKKSVDGGAKFIVTPGFDELIVKWCIDQQVSIFPGVATPTEINLALRMGLDTLKFFPAEALGGIKTLKAIAAPYGDVRFIPTGGINPHNLAEYLEHPSVLACGGSWLVKKSMIADGEFDTIAKLVQEAMKLVNQIQGNK